MIDNRGTELQVGQEVVYNISGQVAKGRILGTDKRWRRSYHTPCVHVELLHSAAGAPAGHVSKVRNPTSVLVLLEGES